MDNFQSHTRKHQLKHKKRLTQEQVRLLEISFNLNNKLNPERKSQLAQELGLPSTRVATWYQNRRARNKNQCLKVTHKALKLRLENVMEDNARLQAEVPRLKQELNKHHLEKELYPSMVADGFPFVSSDGCDFLASSIS
ncbi:homeobox-leucine zipper protein ATHB-52-like [Olea europaea var. sylvestris]|uniref:homeobox-leucine zipper protein ATHB-52-like n=1 Tax=Olea europaea var. sylvestris TaxID=158386 RepID=UPI000C1D07B4|nr:homeobox-leucine zipper protein ATHB-52-like [Olea europaea var. sylvestris]